MASLLNNPIRKALASPFVAGLLISSCVFALCANDAMAQRGGGGRGGGGGGASRGGGGGGGGSHGGRQAKSSVSSGNRASSGGNRSAGGNTANRSGNRSGNTTNRTNNSSRNTNIGSNNNVNVNRGDVNIDVDGGYGYNNGCCRARYPIAAGVAIGAVAGMTAAAVGSYYYGLPSGCNQVTLTGIGYYQCGSAYYQQSMNGDQVVYVSVNP